MLSRWTVLALLSEFVQKSRKSSTCNAFPTNRPGLVDFPGPKLWQLLSKFKPHRPTDLCHGCLVSIIPFWSCIKELICDIFEKILIDTFRYFDMATENCNLQLVNQLRIPEMPHKAVAEVSKIGNYRRGELLWCKGDKANPLMDRQVVGVEFFGLVAGVTSTTTAGCSVV